ncbi:MAG: hypothetical protein JGK14_27115 [Microcoleus sp. PH2017_28_MFU_U_A]|nr:hypothetical protein [Microcoleus sp. PH2017_28_MFU_U_A]
MDSFALSKLKDGGTGLTLLRVLDPDDTLNLTKSTRFVTEIERGGTKGLLNDLKIYTNLSKNPWSFKRGRDLQGSFNIKIRYACGTEDTCPREAIFPDDLKQKYGVGSPMALTYNPLASDPHPNQNKNLYWIQRVITNHPRQGLGVFGQSKSYIDNILRNERGINSPHPYYGISGRNLRPDGLFVDNPYRRRYLNRNFYWIGELYLAEANPSKPREVTIYNGVRWGWTYQYFPKGQPVRVPAFIPKPTQTPETPLELCPPNMLTKSGSTIVANSSSGGGGIGCVAVSPTPKPTPSPTPRPTPSPLPTPRPAPAPSPSPTPSTIILVSPAPTPGPAPVPSAWTPSRTPTPSAWTSSPTPTPSAWTPSPWPTPAPWATTPTPSPRLTSTPLPTPSPWTPSPWPTPTPWVTSPLGSTSSTVVVSTSTTTTTTTTSPSPFQRPSSPIRAARTYATFGVDSDATDLANISSELLEDPELSSTDNSLNNANLAGVSRDLLEDSELSSTDSNENQVNLASISSDLLEDPESSSTDNNENQVNLASISGNLLEDPELSSTDSNENELDLAGISGDLLEDPELASEDNNSLASKTKNPDDDALPAEAVPEPTTELGTLLALTGLGIFLKLKNRKTQK